MHTWYAWSPRPWLYTTVKLDNPVDTWGSQKRCTECMDACEADCLSELLPLPVLRLIAFVCSVHHAAGQ